MSVDLVEPVEGGVVDCLGDVKSEVEAAVVGSTHDEHDLPCLVLDLGDVDVGVLLLQVVGVDECGFMVEVGWTLTEVLGEVVAGLLFQPLGLVGGNAVPEFTAALVEKVDG